MSKKWIVKDFLEHVHGPYETQEILEQIKNGSLGGDEQVASFPEGKWQQISSQPEFFDHLLQAIAEDKKENVQKDVKDSEAFTKTEEKSLDSKEEDQSEDLSQVEMIGDVVDESQEGFEQDLVDFKDEPHHVEAGAEQKNKPTLKAVQHREVKGRSHLFEDRQTYTLEQTEKLKLKARKQKRAKMLLYLLFCMGVGLCISLLFLQEPQQSQSAKYSFKLPDRLVFEIKVDSPQKKNKALKQALKLIATDDVSLIMKAQNRLLAVLQYEPRNEVALLNLCVTNLRLWGYTNKSSENLKVVSQLSKRAAGSGLTGDALTSCRVIEKILYQKFDEATQLTDSYLNVESVDGRSSFFLRYYKGYLLFLQKEYNYAASFLESSVKLEDTWIPALVLLGRAYKKLNRSQESANVFKRVLKINKNHIEALFYLSVLNFDFFSKPKTGYKYFKRADQLSDLKLSDPKVKSLAYSSLARYYLKKGKRKKAKNFGEMAFELDATNVDAKNIMIGTGGKTENKNLGLNLVAEADQLFSEKEWKAAIAIYEEAYKLDRTNSRAALRISEAYWNQSFIKNAIRWAEIAIASDARNAEPYIVLAGYQINQFEFLQAARVLAKARALNKLDYRIYKMYAQIEHLRKNYQRAVAEAQKSLELYSSDSEALLILAQSLEAMGETEKAYANIRAAMEVGRSSFDLENHFVLLLMKTQGLDIAKSYIDQRRRETSGNTKYKIMLSNLYYADEQYRLAAQVAKEANEVLEDESHAAILSYARAVGALGRVETALDYFQKAYLLKPIDVKPLFESGKMLLKSNKPQVAARQFERIYDTNSKYPELLYSWAQALKMMADKKRDEDLVKESIRLAKKELKNNPTYFESYILIAENYYLLGSLAKSQAEKLNESADSYSEKYSEMVSWYKLCSKNYQKALDMSVQDGNIFIDLARCQRLSGEVDQALASAQRAEDLDKSNPRIWIEIGLIYEQKGNTRAAIKSYENFITVLPNAPNKSEVAEKIKSLKQLLEEI